MSLLWGTGNLATEAANWGERDDQLGWVAPAFWERESQTELGRKLW